MKKLLIATALVLTASSAAAQNVTYHFRVGIQHDGRERYVTTQPAINWSWIRTRVEHIARQDQVRKRRISIHINRVARRTTPRQPPINYNLPNPNLTPGDENENMGQPGPAPR